MNLSPATQTILTEIKTQWLVDPEEENFDIIMAGLAAAVLRAVADQVVPKHYSCYTGHGEFDFGMDARNDAIREAILAIAAELDGRND